MVEYTKVNVKLSNTRIRKLKDGVQEDNKTIIQ